MLPTGPLRADQVASTEQPPLRLLAFDGGGVRGISSLYILQAIMAKVSKDPDVKPCKYFDMMCGTSTGGLIALMLGRLQMTIPECINLYTSLASDIFSANLPQRTWNFSKSGAYYKPDKFEQGLKKIIKERTGDENASMLDPDTTNKCKVFVVAGRSQNLSAAAEHFRTYRTRFPDPFAGCPIWQAARATSAAPTYLPPITIKNIEFVDGGLRFNNPSILMMGEVNAIFGIDAAGFGIARHIECFLSIGTGMQPNIKIKAEPSNPFGAAAYMKSLVDASVKIMTDTQATHNLMQGLFRSKANFYASRQKLTLKTDKANLEDSKKVTDLVGEKGGELLIKDLGPQISWRTVFLIEYAGPLFIHPLIYYFPRVWYGQDVQHSELQKYVYAFVMLHFLKRELETIFVHRFSHGTMPFRNVFKNSAHYHLLSGLALAFDVYRPKFAANSSYIAGTIRSNESFLWIMTGIWAFAQLSNLHTHLTLRSLRPANTRVRSIPHGYGFSLMSCPNYFFETLGWTVVTAMTGSIAAAVFLAVSTTQMALWAIKKHKNYKKEFGKALRPQKNFKHHHNRFRKQGSTTVMFIPAVTLTPLNQKYVERQRQTFLSKVNALTSLKGPEISRS
ncbi:hypothetical protein H0H93_016158 [Arthromyces matolae]|nr:hypothetical protein H0H93_016158 [Arthromyces matolae]